MNHPFRVSGVESEPFAKLFELSDEVLRKEHQAARCTANGDFGFPCRGSLEDAKTGDELLLLPFDQARRICDSSIDGSGGASALARSGPPLLVRSGPGADQRQSE